MNKALIIAVVMALAGCGCSEREPVTEVPSKFCESTLTGKTSIRKWSECVQVGKNTCASKINKSKPTEELETVCRFVTWRDK